MKKKILSLLVAGGLAVAFAPAAPAETAPEYMTKGEAVQLLSATDFMKKKIGELLSWTIGYDISKVSRVRLTPTINYVKAVPRTMPPDGRTILELVASVDDPGGLSNIAGVRADLSSIGRLPNTMLVDNGMFGDEIASDGIYTLQTSVPARITAGSKDVPVAVANKKGWLALAKTSLEVKKNPSIVQIVVSPERVLAGSNSSVTITVRVENPGRIDDVESVAAGLESLGLSERALLRNDGLGGDSKAKDDLWTINFTVPAAAGPGTYTIPIDAANYIGGTAFGRAVINVEE